MPKPSRKLHFAKRNLIRGLKHRRVSAIGVAVHVYEEIRLDSYDPVDEKGEWIDCNIEKPDDVKMVRADRDFFWWSDQQQEVIGKIVIGPDDWDVHDLDWVGSRLILKRSPGEWGLKAKLYNVADSEWMEAEAIHVNVRELCETFSLARNRRGRRRHKGWVDVERHFELTPTAQLMVPYVRSLSCWDKYPNGCPSETTIKRWIKERKAVADPRP